MISSESHSHIALILEALEIGDELYWDPCRQVISAWPGHFATAFWLVKAARPTLFVELGTHNGSSYSAFCQAIAQLGLPARAFAVDTWQGDEHSGLYGEEVFEEFQAFNESHFLGFSKLLRSTFDGARSYFPDTSIDLLHIDGLHTYEAVKHDFDTWKSALSASAVVVFHDTNVRERDFGVWKLWKELAEIYPSFEFHHSEGLGVLGVGETQPRLLRRLFEIGSDPQSAAIVRRIFASRGETFRNRLQVLSLSDDLQQQLGRISALEQGLADQRAIIQDRDQQIAVTGEGIRTLQLDMAARETILSDVKQQLDATLRNRDEEMQRATEAIRQRELTIASKDQTINAKQRKIAELDGSGAKLRTQLAEATDRLAQQKAADELLQQDLAGLRTRLGLIESSSAWKVASRVSSTFQGFPRLRSYARRLGRLLWWTVSFQLIGRLRARRRLFETRDLIADSQLFDGAWYLSQFPDIAAAGYDPALHYALFGATEHRAPGPDFDAQAYLERYADVAQAGMNPLVHYLEHGATEGRVIGKVGAGSNAAEVPAAIMTRDYQSWVTHFDTINDEDRAAIRDHIERLQDRPLISVVMPVYNTRPEFLRKALDSVLAQLYPMWELCIADDASTNHEVRTILDDYARRDRRIKLVYRNDNGHISAASNSALQLATGRFIALMDHDDELPEHALYMVAATLHEHPDADIIYSDEDKIDANGVRQTPYFKPDWNPELFYSQNYVSHLGVYRASLVRQVGGFREGFEGSQDYDLALRIVSLTGADRIRHIPHVLYHWRTAPGVQTFSIDNLPTAVQASRRALAEYFAERGEDVRVTGGNQPQFNRVIRQPPDPAPFVSVIIPTRDRMSLLRGCVDGLLHRTAYDNLEIIIVDNDSCEEETAEYLNSLRKESKIRILRMEGEFNYSALNNRAASQAKGDLIALLNNDIEVIHPEWLQEMVTQVMQPGVGAVGAKLYYSDHTLQHAGVIVGLGGVAGHSHLRQPRSDAGYFGRLHLVHEVSCVTGACLLIHKNIFLELGGLDENELKIAFNDVDLCLRLRKAGYRIIWTPYAELYHLESASRGYDFDPVRVERIIQESNVMIERWGKTLQEDPFYNPNLSLIASENHKPAFPPRVLKPWILISKRENPHGQLNAFSQVGGR